LANVCFKKEKKKQKLVICGVDKWSDDNKLHVVSKQATCKLYVNTGIETKHQ